MKEMDSSLRPKNSSSNVEKIHQEYSPNNLLTFFIFSMMLGLIPSFILKQFHLLFFILITLISFLGLYFLDEKIKSRKNKNNKSTQNNNKTILSQKEREKNVMQKALDFHNKNSYLWK